MADIVNIGSEPAPDWLVTSLALSKAQADAGLTVPLEPALERVRASMARMEAKRAETVICG